VRCKRGKSDWCGHCYATLRGRASHPGSRSGKRPVRSMTEARSNMAMKRPTDNPKEKAGSKVVDEVLRGWLPDLHEFLTENQWDDGKARKTGTMMILTQDGVWKAWIHDTDLRVSGWVSAESWESLLETVNRGFGENSISWKADKR